MFLGCEKRVGRTNEGEKEEKGPSKCTSARLERGTDDEAQASKTSQEGREGNRERQEVEQGREAGTAEETGGQTDQGGEGQTGEAAPQSTEDDHTEDHRDQAKRRESTQGQMILKGAKRDGHGQERQARSRQEGLGGGEDREAKGEEGGEHEHEGVSAGDSGGGGASHTAEEQGTGQEQVVRHDCMVRVVGVARMTPPVHPVFGGQAGGHPNDRDSGAMPARCLMFPERLAQTVVGPC